MEQGLRTRHTESALERTYACLGGLGRKRLVAALTRWAKLQHLRTRYFVDEMQVIQFIHDIQGQSYGQHPLLHGKRHPEILGEPEVVAFLNHLAVDRKVAASTQSQALNALVFLYSTMLEKPLPQMIGLKRVQHRFKSDTSHSTPVN